MGERERGREREAPFIDDGRTGGRNGWMKGATTTTVVGWSRTFFLRVVDLAAAAVTGSLRVRSLSRRLPIGKMDDGQNEFCAKEQRERPHGTVRALIGRVAVCSAPLQMGKEIDCRNILHFDGAERSLDAGWRLICAQIAVIMFPKKVVQAESG